jgi:hypothetical protein
VGAFTPVLFGIAALSLLPAAARKAFAGNLSKRGRWLQVLSILFWTAFFIFGAYRWLGVMTGYLTFPPPAG